MNQLHLGIVLSLILIWKGPSFPQNCIFALSLSVRWTLLDILLSYFSQASPCLSQEMFIFFTKEFQLPSTIWISPPMAWNQSFHSNRSLVLWGKSLTFWSCLTWTWTVSIHLYDDDELNGQRPNQIIHFNLEGMVFIWMLENVAPFKVYATTWKALGYTWQDFQRKIFFCNEIRIGLFLL